MMGNINEIEFEINKFEHYYGANYIPKTGDFIIAALLDENTIDETWIFKCS